MERERVRGEGGREGGSGEGRDIVVIEHAVHTHTYTHVQ